MINYITLTNYLGESIKLSLTDPSKHGLVIKKIAGLGPCKADIRVHDIATFDGGIFNSSRVNSRNIVLTLGFHWSCMPANKSVEDLRQLTYKYLPIKQRVTFTIETDNRIAETYGYVESNEPDIFSKDETVTISIVCPDSYFYSAGKNGTNVTVFSGIEAMLSFPLCNDSLTDNLLKVGEIRYSTEKTVYYDGDAEIGILIRIHAVGDVENITIYNTTTREMMRIDTTIIQKLTGSGIIYGDDIFISTVKNDKSAYLLRDGKYINILNSLDRNSNWFMLSKGDNIFAYTAEKGAVNLEFQIGNQILYEGV